MLALLIAFPIAAVAALAFSFGGMGMVAGRDIGFAGAGLWFVMAPSAVIALVASLVVDRIRRPEDAWLRAIAFVAVAAGVSFFLSAIAARAVLELLKSGTPEYAYVPAPGQYAAKLEIAVAPQATVGQPVHATATYQGGPWVRVKSKELSRPPYLDVSMFNQDHEPPLVDKDAARAMFWHSEPWGVERYSDPEVATRQPPLEFALAFRSPGSYKVWAESNSMPAHVKSNVVTVTVAPK